MCFMFFHSYCRGDLVTHVWDSRRFGLYPGDSQKIWENWHVDVYITVYWKAMGNGNYRVNPWLKFNMTIHFVYSFLQDFEKNSFEQMCINFANETLQFFFNQFVFRMEQVSLTLHYYASHKQFISVRHHAR